MDLDITEMNTCTDPSLNQNHCITLFIIFCAYRIFVLAPLKEVPSVCLSVGPPVRQSICLAVQPSVMLV